MAGKGKFSYPLEIFYARLNAVQTMPNLNKLINLRDPYANPEYDFCDDPAYRLGYPQEIIAARKVFNEGNRHSPVISRFLLMRKIEDQRQSGDAISDSTRHREIMRMERLLEEENGSQDSVQAR